MARTFFEFLYDLTELVEDDETIYFIKQNFFKLINAYQDYLKKYTYSRLADDITDLAISNNDTSIQGELYGLRRQIEEKGTLDNTAFAEITFSSLRLNELNSKILRLSNTSKRIYVWYVAFGVIWHVISKP